MSTEKQTQIEAEAPKTEGQAVAERLEKPETKQALADKLAKKPVAERAKDFVANPPESSFSSKEFAIDENLKGKKMEAQVKTSLNVRNAEGKVSASGKPGEKFVLTGETTKDGRFVGIESGNGEKKFVAVSYLKDSKADQAQTAPKTEAAGKWPTKAEAAGKPKESDSVTKDKPEPKPESTKAKPEAEPVRETQKTQPKPTDSKEKSDGLFSTEPGKPVVTPNGTYEGQYKVVKGTPVFEGQGKVSKDGLSFEGTFKNGSPAWIGKITSGKQTIEAEFDGFSIKEGPGKITSDGTTKEGTFKFENRVSTKATPTGGTETTTEKKVVFESEGVLYRANPKTSQFEAVKSTDTPASTAQAEGLQEKVGQVEFPQDAVDALSKIGISVEDGKMVLPNGRKLTPDANTTGISLVSAMSSKQLLAEGEVRPMSVRLKVDNKQWSPQELRFNRSADGTMKLSFVKDGKSQEMDVGGIQKADASQGPSRSAKQTEAVEAGTEKLSETERAWREIVSNGESLKKDLTVIKSKASLLNISKTADTASARVKDYLDASEPKFQTLSKDKAGLSPQTRSDIMTQLEDLAKLAKTAEWSSFVPERTKEEVRQYSQRIEAMKSSVA